ncbi:MAG: hypothetical protein Roseis2KO_14520 [Roseivirga sp.]
MMKRKYQLLLGVLIAVILVFTTGCDEATTPGCDRGGKIIHSVEEVEGHVSMYEDTNDILITYFVPGTIDSAWSGVVCNDLFPDFKIDENTRVKFSGNFRDDDGDLQPLVAFGGQSFFYLELTAIEEIN